MNDVKRETGDLDISDTALRRIKKYCGKKIKDITENGWFQWYFRYWLGRRWKDHKKQINRWKKFVSRFRGKLLKTIKNSGSKYDDYLISPKIRQILLHWDYELTKKDFELSN